MTKEADLYQKEENLLSEREKETMALDFDTSVETLLKLAFDSSEKVRALVGVNRNTPRVILMELKKDASELVRRTANYNLNCRDLKNKNSN